MPNDSENSILDWEDEIINVENYTLEGLENTIKVSLRTEPDINIRNSLLLGFSSTVSLICIEGYENFCGIWKVLEITNNQLICTFTDPSNKLFCNSKESPAYIRKVKYEGEYELQIKRKISNDEKLKPKVSIIPPLIFYSRTTIYSISNIDTINQSFSSDYFVEFRLKRVIDYEDEDLTMALLACCQCQAHMINFLNVHETIGEKEVWTRMELIQSTKLYDFVFKIRQKTTIEERMELEDFPWDVQDLNITVALFSSNKRARLRKNLEYPSIFQIVNFQLSSIFEVLYQDIVLSKVLQTDPSESSAGIIYDKIQFTVYVSRSSGYYLTNVIIPMAVLTFLSPASCFVEEDGSSLSVGDRLSITLTLILTAVAYKFVVAAALPTISYMTLLDHYVLLCFGLMCVNAIENVVYPSLGALYGTSKDGEWYFVIGFYILYFQINILVIWYIWRCVKKREQWHEAVLVLERIRREYVQLKSNTLKCTTKQLAILDVLDASPESKRECEIQLLRNKGLPLDWCIKAVNGENPRVNLTKEKQKKAEFCSDDVKKELDLYMEDVLLNYKSTVKRRNVQIVKIHAKT